MNRATKIHKNKDFFSTVFCRLIPLGN